MGRPLGNPGRMLSLCLVASVALQLPAGAQEMPPVYVYTEGDSDADTACQVRGATLVATVEAALRYNNATITSRDQLFSYKAIAAYVRATTIMLSSGHCATHVSLSFQHFQPISDRVTGDTMLIKSEYCQKGGIYESRRSEMQTRLNDALGDFTNECVSEYLSLRR